MKTKRSLSIGLSTAALAVSLLSACGSGGGVTTTGGGLPGGGTGGTASMNVTTAQVTPATVHLGQQAAVHWTVAYSTPAVGYWTEFHVNSQPSLISGMSGATRVFSANGDLGPGTVGKDATINCTFQLASGRPALVCGTYGSRYMDTFDLTKPVYGIIKACTFDEKMDPVCAEKATGPLTFSTAAAKEAVGVEAQEMP